MAEFNNYSKEVIERYTRELLEACLTFDVETFKSFVNKWYTAEYYPPCFSLPADEVIEITLRKIVVNRRDAPRDKQEEAADWLLSRGYDLDLE